MFLVHKILCINRLALHFFAVVGLYCGAKLRLKVPRDKFCGAAVVAVADVATDCGADFRRDFVGVFRKELFKVFQYQFGFSNPRLKNTFSDFTQTLYPSKFAGLCKSTWISIRLVPSDIFSSLTKKPSHIDRLGRRGLINSTGIIFSNSCRPSAQIALPCRQA